jgi:hypothetical protein
MPMQNRPDRNQPHKSKEYKGEKNEEETRKFIETIEWELIN